ncbi:uncharacterized protein LOC133185032 [Saccostrea echinata]|uniref:uncharacterized protein LOC133185032 n=1 Tax=Saccostrea echinata TaxID=191078 RepID=UPI002A8295DA|nr:uncharacterized protein LOC133185032 [Saccostrea echinata]
MAAVFGAHHHHRSTTTPKPTTPTTTQKPTPESFEYGYTFFFYDNISHYICSIHVTRLNRLCLCYHVPYDERDSAHDPNTALDIEKRMYALYDAGHHTPMNDLQFYSKTNYDMCIDHGKNLNTTIELVYP